VLLESAKRNSCCSCGKTMMHVKCLRPLAFAWLMYVVAMLKVDLLAVVWCRRAALNL